MKKLLLSFILLLALGRANAQLPDSLNINVGSVGTAAKEGYQPLWLVANRWGAISDQQYDASTYAGFSNAHYFGKKYPSKFGPAAAGAGQQPFYVRYGANLIASNHFSTLTLQEGYVKAGFKQLELRAGRFKYLPGEVDQDLSSGSLGVSGNALPIPQVTLALTDYVNVPFTSGWLQVRAQLSHGWLGPDRFLSSYYHEKNFYARLGKGKFRVFAGAQHYVEWGGRRGDSIRLDRSFKGFANVLFATSNADDGSAQNLNVRGASARAGDQRGIVEVGFELETRGHLLHFYHQSPFEGTFGVDVRNIDNLSGLGIVPKKANAVLKKLLVEFIYTRQSENYAPPGSRQGYYNNGYYKTGWEYQGRIVGTPLFVNRTRAQYYPYFAQRGIAPFDWNDPGVPGNSNIIYNRVVGGNIGLLLRFNDQLSGKTRLAYTSGAYGNGPDLGQFYSLQEVYCGLSKSVSFSAGFALDAGDLSHNYGGLLGLHWQLKGPGRQRQ